MVLLLVEEEAITVETDTIGELTVGFMNQPTIPSMQMKLLLSELKSSSQTNQCHLP